MDDYSTYEELLGRWALYDCSAFVNPRSDEEMRELFERWRATRSKPATAIGATIMQSLDRAWTAFVARLNTETGSIFIQKLKERDATYARLSLGELASQVCELSWEADRRCCLAHYLDDCRSCRGCGVPRPNTAEWEGSLEETPLSDTERLVAGRYRAALVTARRGGRARCRSENFPLSQRSPHTPPRSPGRLRGELRAARNYRVMALTNTQDTDNAQEQYRRGNERPDAYVGKRESHRALGSPQRYAEYYLHCQREVQDHRTQTEERHRYLDAEVTQRQSRIGHRLERLEREG